MICKVFLAFLRALVVVGACCSFVFGQSHTERRIWTDITGKHKTEATFLNLKDGEVRLQKMDGKTVGIPLERLSEPDQAFVKETVSRQTGGKAKGANSACADMARTPATKTRTWTWTGPAEAGSVARPTTLEAELVSASDGNVELRTANGEIITVPIRRLCISDQDFLRNEAAAGRIEKDALFRNLLWPWLISLAGLIVTVTSLANLNNNDVRIASLIGCYAGILAIAITWLWFFLPEWEVLPDMELWAKVRLSLLVAVSVLAVFALVIRIVAWATGETIGETLRGPRDMSSLVREYAALLGQGQSLPPEVTSSRTPGRIKSVPASKHPKAPTSHSKTTGVLVDEYWVRSRAVLALRELCLLNDVPDENARVTQVAAQIVGEGVEGARVLAKLVRELLDCRSPKILHSLTVARSAFNAPDLVRAVTAVKDAPVLSMPPDSPTFAPLVAKDNKVGWDDATASQIRGRAREVLARFSSTKTAVSSPLKNG